MGIRLRPPGKFQFLTAAGAPGNGYKVNCYEPGTTTRKDTYTDYTGDTANANPVILNARGEADIWWNGIYKIVITDDADVEIYTVDNYGEGEDATLTGNYVKNKNGGFETDSSGDGLPDDWTITEYDATSTVLIDTSDQIEGLNSLKFTSTGLGGGYADSDFFAVQEGKILSISAMLKSSVVDVRNVIDILWYTAAKSLISTTNIYDESAANPTTWTEKTGEATPPSTARFAKIRVIGCHSSDATSGSTWFDDVKVLDDLSASQAEVDAGTITGKFITPGTLAAYTPVSPTNYVGGIETHLHGDSANSTIFDIDAVIGAAWESVGPTGSGADNIWTALDDVPAGAVGVRLRIQTSINGSTNGDTYQKILYARVTGSSTAVGVRTEIASASFNNRSGAQELDSNMVDVIIPLDSSLLFDLYHLANGTGVGGQLNAHLVGWIE